MEGDTSNTTVGPMEERTLSHDSEYDDFLGVPDSLEITINENGEAISLHKENEEQTDNCEGKLHLTCTLYFAHTEKLIVIIVVVSVRNADL